MTSGSRRIPLHNPQGEVVAHTLVDAADYQALTQHRWYRSHERYARRGRGKRKVYLHRELLGLATGDPLMVDHINRDRLDNRRENLRVVTRAQQQQNLSARGGTSSHRGVHMRKASGRWVAQGTLDGKLVSLGTFDSEDEAARVAADFRRQHMPFSTETLPAAPARDPRASSRSGSSRFRGVVWNKGAHRWMAYGSTGGKRKHLGYFESEEAAADVAAAWRAQQ